MRLRQCIKSQRKELIIVLAITSFIIILHSWSLMRYPAPFVDEAWLAARAWALIKTGKAFGSLDTGIFETFDGHWTFFPWLPTWIQSLSLRPFSVPSLIPLRIISLVFGFILLASIYAIGKAVGGKKLGLMSAVLVSLSTPFFISSHMARPDIFTAALGFLAVALFINNTKSKLWVSIISGICVAMAFEMHPNGVIYGPTIVALHMLKERSKFYRSLQFWGFIAGTGLGLLFYVFLHIIRYPETFFAINRYMFSSTHLPFILNWDFSTTGADFKRTAYLLIFSYLITVPLGMWSIIGLCMPKYNRYSPLYILGLSLLISRVVMVQNWLFYYIILFSPAFDLLLAAFVLHILEMPWKSNLERVLRYGLVLILLGLIHWQIYSTQINFNESSTYNVVQRKINESIDPNEVIMGPQTYWLGLWDHPYYSWQQLVYYQQYSPKSDLLEAMEYIKPDIFIIDGHLKFFITDDNFELNYFEFLRLPKIELYNILGEKGELISEFSDKYYGDFEVYRFTW